MPLRKTKKGIKREGPRREFSVAPRPKKVCFYCENKKNVIYTDTATLSRFVSERVKIVPKIRSGACSKHQRQITKHIKYARHLGLLPFVARVN